MTARYFIFVLLFLLSPLLMLAESKPEAASQIEVGMQYEATLKLLKETKMKHLEIKQISPDEKVLSFRWDSYALTVPDKLIDSKSVLTFEKDMLVNIQMYSRKGVLLDSNLKTIFIQSNGLW